MRSRVPTLPTTAAVAGFAGFLEHWEAARADYGAGRFGKALAGFQAAAARRPDDGPCRVFIARCTGLLDRGVQPGWDGIWRHDRK